MSDSGHRDLDGNWVPETTQAKLRNKLSPFWNLVDMLSNDDILDRLLASDKGRELIKKSVQTCRDNQSIVLELIDETGK